MMKPVRDAVVTGTPATLVLSVLLDRGAPVDTATLLAVVAAAVASAVYRAIRAHCPWLLAVDAPSGAQH